MPRYTLRSLFALLFTFALLFSILPTVYSIFILIAIVLFLLQISIAWWFLRGISEKDEEKQ